MHSPSPQDAAIGQSPDGERCRLCGGQTAFRFSKLVLGKYDVAYAECRECGSLQTETPYWLDEAYRANDATANLSELDTGAASRNLSTSAATQIVAWLLGYRNILDFGGGDGLTCRLLRDHGFNAYVVDRYAPATYALGFTTPDFDRADLVTAFEVMEHFADPAAELEQVLGLNADAVLVSTSIYSGQDTDWWYLSPGSGQHVFFYSERGMALVAKRFGYHLLRAGNFTLFVRRMSPRARLAPLLLRRELLPLARGITAALPAWGAQRDLDRLKAPPMQRGEGVN